MTLTNNVFDMLFVLAVLEAVVGVLVNWVVAVWVVGCVIRVPMDRETSVVVQATGVFQVVKVTDGLIDAVVVVVGGVIGILMVVV